MQPKFCQYCGAPLEDHCSCLRELAEYQETLIEELENRPETLAGWAFEDQLEIRRREQ